MLGFYDKPCWWDTKRNNYGLFNTVLWSDLEEGIIRQGGGENPTGNRYKRNNPRKIQIK